MVKSLISTFLICLVFFYANAQQSLQIKLTKISGNTSGNRTFGRFLTNYTGFNIDTFKYQSYGVWEFEFDHLQNAYNRSKLSKVERSNNKDNINDRIYPGFKNSTYVLAAIRNDGQFILIPDIDASKNFTNQQEFQYRIKMVPHDSVNVLSQKLPVINFKIPTWYKGNKYFTSLAIQFIPKSYFGNFKKTIANPVADVLNICAASVDYFKGDFNISDKDYTIYVQNESPDIRFFEKSNIKLLLAEKSGSITSANLDDDKLTLNLNDSIPILNDLYKVNSIDLYGKSITLDYAGRNTFRGIREGMFAKNFVSNDITTNVLIDLNLLKGKYVLLDFWGTWCIPCKELEPELKKINQSASTKDIKIIGIAYDKGIDEVKKYVLENQMKWANIFQKIGPASSDNEIINYYKVNSFPTSILLDPTGKIIFRGEGVNDFQKLKELIAKTFN